MAVPKNLCHMSQVVKIWKHLCHKHGLAVRENLCHMSYVEKFRTARVIRRPLQNNLCHMSQATLVGRSQKLMSYVIC